MLLLAVERDLVLLLRLGAGDVRVGQFVDEDGGERRVGLIDFGGDRGRERGGIV